MKRRKGIEQKPAQSEPLGDCPLCGRPMLAGATVDRHHWIPRRNGGTAWSWMHMICHRKIHAVLDEASLARGYPDAESLRAHPEIARFLAWVAHRPPEFNDWHRTPRRGRR